MSKRQKTSGSAASVSMVLDDATGFRKIILESSSGAKVEAFCHGAHVTSWKRASGKEMLWMSKTSSFSPDSPIRGGIPVAFPQFGGGPLPLHGFARVSEWKVKAELSQGDSADDVGVSATFSLENSEATAAVWPHNFALSYTVCLSADGESLTCDLTVKNVDSFGSAPVPFQALLHTYFAAAASKVAVEGFNGCEYLDKVSLGSDGEPSPGTETRDTIGLTGETDCIYKKVPGAIKLRTGHNTIRVAHCLRLDKGCELPADVVLWNPWTAKSAKMSDFDDDGWQHMVCVEPGFVRENFALHPLQWLSLKQTLVIES